MSTSDLSADPTGTGTGATDAETDDQPSVPVPDRGGDDASSEGRDVNAGTQSDDLDADASDAARDAYEEQLDAGRAQESYDTAREPVPTDPRAGTLDAPDAPNV